MVKMIMKRWDQLPENMRNDNVKYYYDILKEKQVSLFLKRIFDIIFAILLSILLLPLFAVVSIAIKMGSKGPIMFRQVRVTQYGRKFRIFKFRTMIKDAEKFGLQITTNEDARVTKVGKFLREYKLDEIPQLLNIIKGDMSFVGTRPEVIKYVSYYSDEMKATLLLPAGVTSEASIQYKNEELIIPNTDDSDKLYIKYVLPEKMKYNLKSIEEFSIFNELNTILKTVIRVIKEPI